MIDGISHESSWFTKFAQKVATFSGKPATFLLAISTIIVWAVTGPFFHFNDTWQLVINTSTTIVTFLMVFLIQNTQNRDTAAMQLKLDELICAVQGADKALLDLEELDESELKKIRDSYESMAAEARAEDDRQRGAGQKPYRTAADIR